ncbi:MAG: TonB family protein, partial [Actinobacteria bacterium]|nr:energy transducer TonB [Actinomycetota bacterium]NIS33935.1 energy transducer TonB [Actinomycetota bacterium]NIW30591.1 TonB family protein [Actinomycetota bacterium]NIX23008.1 TonB family protein [Actinomycetota bacterium]
MAATLTALLLGGAAVPQARASLVRLIGALAPDGDVSPADAVGMSPPVALTTPAPEDVEPESVATPTGEEVTDAEASGTLVSELILPQMLDREHAQRLLRDAYPDALQLGGIGGTVRLRMRVDEDGRVLEPSVARSSGVEELDRLAVRLAPRFRFVPALRDGEPMGMRIEFPVVFEPEPESEPEPEPEP